MSLPRLCRYEDPVTRLPTMGAVDDSGSVWPMRIEGHPFPDLDAWLARCDALEFARHAAMRAVETGGGPIGTLPTDADAGRLKILAPVETQEVWASGVTYERSREARMAESDSGGSFYDKVYHAERPELFFKATARRVSGWGEPVRIRRDSTWNVPEPELTCVVSSHGEIVGYTVGNDMSSRSIEGENPLYLPQAKVYRGCCALGPVIALAGEGGVSDARALGITLTIRREGAERFQGAISTARMKRDVAELVDWLFREDDFPHGALLLTGTGIVPPDDFTLQPGDTVEIAIEGIGALWNPIA